MKTLWLVILTAVLAIVLYREFVPPKVIVKPGIPQIVTKHDTTETLPSWFEDSIKIWKKRPASTDTFTLVITNTVVDTEFVPVNAPPEQRPNLWPVLEYHGPARAGDTAVVSTFSVRNGNLAISKVYTPGILVGIEADSTTVPRLTFAPFPEPKKPSLFYKLKMIGVGYGACSIVNSVR